MIISGGAPSGALMVGRLARGILGETRRVVHVFGMDTVEAGGELVRTRCGETLSRTDVEWLTPGTGMPCERCLGLAGSDRTSSLPVRPQRELGV